MTVHSFDELRLAEPVQRALHDAQYTTPTPIQAQSIPAQLEGRDLMGCAQTGTGKTAAFALPILSHLAGRPERVKSGRTRVLVLTPTRELAVQVGKSFETYGRHLRLRHSLVYGGVSQKPQVRNLAKGVDILVATPGRLLDLMNQGHVKLQSVEYLVLDEVDRMLDMGFIQDVRKIVLAVPDKRQTALFSATFSPDVEKFAKDFVADPFRVSITPENPVVENIQQQICFVQQEHKQPLLQARLRDQQERGHRESTIVFCRTKYGTEKLSRKLNSHGFRTEAIHGDKSQGARQKALDAFRAGKVPVLIATDVAARGIDVRSISLVVNYDLPEAADSYVHRIGRTARAEAEGHAISFCTARDVGLLAQIERYIGRKIDVDLHHPFHDQEAADHSTHHSRRPKTRHGTDRAAKAPHWARRKRKPSADNPFQGQFRRKRSTKGRKKSAMG